MLSCLLSAPLPWQEKHGCTTCFNTCCCCRDWMATTIPRNKPTHTHAHHCAFDLRANLSPAMSNSLHLLLAWERQEHNADWTLISWGSICKWCLRMWVFESQAHILKLCVAPRWSRRCATPTGKEKTSFQSLSNATSQAVTSVTHSFNAVPSLVCLKSG
jgi:hypothetical protein